MTDCALAAGPFSTAQGLPYRGQLLTSYDNRCREAGYFAQEKREEARKYY